MGILGRQQHEKDSRGQRDSQVRLYCLFAFLFHLCGANFRQRQLALACLMSLLLLYGKFTMGRNMAEVDAVLNYTF